MIHAPLALSAKLALALAITLGSWQHARGATAVAYGGAPFGVGRITIAVGGSGPVAPLEDERFTVADLDGRVLYPVVKIERVRRLLRQLLEIDRPRNATIYFLFRGEGPLDVQAFAPTAQTLQVDVINDPASHARLLAEWWEAYAARWQDLQGDPQFPPVVENFVAANMSRRLGFALPGPPTGLLSAFRAKATVWDDLLVTERRQLQIDRELLTDVPADGAAAAESLPPQMPWYDLPAPDGSEAPPATEPIAAHVPQECFYARFGTFTNYLWFRDLSRKWDGDLGNMIMRRGIDRTASHRIEQQLSLRENAMAKILGPQIIADVAIIGLDPYVNQGAGIGVLFHARVSPVLARDLNEQRREALEKFPDAAETTLKIGDRDVSLIATPGGEVRSYYVADGDFHLVTTSRRLVQRFLQAGAGDRPLSASVGFEGIRRRAPHDQGDAMFIYVGPEFFRELTSPPMWIEAQRRARSQREANVLRLALLQASAEGVAAPTTADLIASGLLPQNFGARADGSELSISDAGDFDSLRGRVGCFVAAADMDVATATVQEAAAYRRFGDRFRQEVGQMPPIGIAVQRTVAADGASETLTANVLATPLEGLKLGRLPEILGDPSADRVAPIDGDVVRLEMVLEAPPLPLLGGDNELHHLFVGVRDFRTPLVIDAGRVAPGARPPELVRMYVGAWPRPGMLKLLAGPQLAEGPDPAPGAMDTWQARRDDFLLISFKPDLVTEVLSQLTVVTSDRPAQVRLDIADLTGKDLASAVNAFGYMRTREASVASSRLMNTLANQLHVPREACLDVAQRLVDGAFQCPLGGTYELTAAPGELPMWTSTAVLPQNRFLLTQAPDEFTLPALTWFQGLHGDLSLDDDALGAQIQIKMAKSAVP